MNDLTVTLTKWGLGGIFASLSYYTGWSELMGFLLILMFIDFGSGILGSAIEGKLLSKTGFNGILRKLMIIFVVVGCHVADLILQLEQTQVLGLNVSSPIQTLAIVFYCGNELLSIAENADRSGVKFPKGIKNLFEQMRDKGDSDL